MQIRKEKLLLHKDKEFFNTSFSNLNLIDIFYWRNENSYLSKLCDKYGTDKGTLKSQNQPSLWPWPATSYADYYSLLFDHCRQYIRNVFECGIGTTNIKLKSNMGPKGKPGASLKVWNEYFQKADIYGADIDKNILFKEDRIKTYYVDQTDSMSIAKLWDEVGVEYFDVMIDDGLHTCEAAICLFENAIHKLSDSGIYFIEDLDNSSLVKFHQYIDKKKYQTDIIVFYKPQLRAENNNIITIRKVPQ